MGLAYGLHQGHGLHTCAQMLLLCNRAVLHLADDDALLSLALQLLGALLVSLPSAHAAHLMNESEQLRPPP